MKPKGGVSLVETLVVISIASVMFGVVTTLLYTMLRAEQSGRREIERREVLDSLADQFRGDAHAATRCQAMAAEAGGGRSGWRFELPERRSIVYEADAERMLRTEWVGEARQRHESYNLPAESTARIEIQNGSGSKLVSLLIVPTAEAAAEPPGDQARIDAMLGTDHRFAKREERL